MERFFTEIIDFIMNIDIIKILMNLIACVLILFAFRIAVKLFNKAIDKVEKRAHKFTPLMATYVKKCISVVGWILAVIIDLQFIGINMGPIVAGLGVSGLVLGLAAQETISNFLSGAMIVLNAPFGIGDYIQAGDLSGTVAAMDMMCVTLSTPDNRKIMISNKVIWANPIINFSDMDRRRVDLVMSVAYGTDLELAKKVAREVIQSYPEVMKDPAPVVEVNTLAGSSIDIVVRPWVLPKDYWPVYWRFYGDIVPKLADVGISIPFPQLDVHFYDVNSTDVPPEVRKG